jgi:UDP-glucose 4-epimerase
MRILVPGGDGFIGSHMVRHLVAEGHRVTVLENRPVADARRVSDLADRIEWIEGDCDDGDFSREVCDGVDVVYYLASSTNPAATWDSPTREIRENVLRATSFLEAAAAAGVRKSVLPSSGGTVYGMQRGVVTEATPPLPFSPHGIAKYSAELFARALGERTGMAVDIYRISNPYGPAQPWDTGQGVVAVWLNRILRGEPVRVYGDRETKRDYIHVSDVCKLMYLSVLDPASSGTYNLSSGQVISILELLELFHEVAPVEFVSQAEPRRAFDNLSTHLDNGLILSRFPGFTFKPFAEGLRETWEWYAQELAQPVQRG